MDKYIILSPDEKGEWHILSQTSNASEAILEHKALTEHNGTCILINTGDFIDFGTEVN